MAKYDLFKNSILETLEGVPEPYIDFYVSDEENGGFRLTDNKDTLKALNLLNTTINTLDEVKTSVSPWEKLKDYGDPDEIIKELTKPAQTQPAPVVKETEDSPKDTDTKVSKQWHKTQVAKIEKEFLERKNSEVEKVRQELTAELASEKNLAKKQFFESTFKRHGAFDNSLDYLSSRFMDDFDRDKDPNTQMTNYYKVDGSGLKDVNMGKDGVEFLDLDSFVLQTKANPDYAHFFASEVKSGSNTPTQNNVPGKYRSAEEQRAFAAGVHPDQIFNR